MNNQTFFLIVIIFVLISYLPIKFSLFCYKDNDNTTLAKNQKSQVGLTQELINDYLSETNCKENFDTMGPNTNIGNNMAFKEQQPKSKSLSDTLVPDFEPTYLDTNLNSFGYVTNEPEADKYYENRGFMNPTNGYKYADSIQWMLAHPYQTRYCDNKN